MLVTSFWVPYNCGLTYRVLVTSFLVPYDGAPEFDSTLVDGSFTINLDPMLVPIFEKVV